MKTKIKIPMKHVLGSNSAVARWALLRVYENQNENEQITGEATELNGQGFSKCDSEILTSLSQFLSSRGFLSAKQMAILHRRLPKYWRQVVEGLRPVEMDGFLTGIVPRTPIGLVRNATARQDQV
jgi:hypothetical protein